MNSDFPKPRFEYSFKLLVNAIHFWDKARAGQYFTGRNYLHWRFWIHCTSSSWASGNKAKPQPLTFHDKNAELALQFVYISIQLRAFVKKIDSINKLTFILTVSALIDLFSDVLIQEIILRCLWVKFNELCKGLDGLMNQILFRRSGSEGFQLQSYKQSFLFIFYFL